MALKVIRRGAGNQLDGTDSPGNQRRILQIAGPDDAIDGFAHQDDYKVKVSGESWDEISVDELIEKVPRAKR